MYGISCQPDTMCMSLLPFNDTLVYNIFVRDLPKGATANDVTEYFQIFGRVLKVSMLNGRKKCFVNFAETEVAARVLQATYHVYKNEYICVEPCDSLNQPDGQRIAQVFDKKFDQNFATENAFNQEALIFNLNDDCLETICKKLSADDQINFALTCERFCNILLILSKVRYATLYTSTFFEWSLLKVKLFLQIVGPQVKTLYISAHSNISTYYKFLGLYCTNIDKLHIISKTLPKKAIRGLVRQMQRVQELEIQTDSCLNWLRVMQNLKCLSIWDNNHTTGKHIRLLRGLEKLSIGSCLNFTSQNFRNICKSLKNLYYLDIIDCYSLKAEDFEHLSKNLLQLKILKLSNNGEDINCVAQLPNLKCLEINNNSKCTLNGFLKNLATYKSNQLEELKLQESTCVTSRISSIVAEFKKLKVLHCAYNLIKEDSYNLFSHLTELEEIQLSDCSKMTSKKVLKILESSLKLKRIVLERYIWITETFVQTALQLLQKQRDERLRTDVVYIRINPETGIPHHNTHQIRGVAVINFQRVDYDDDSNDDFSYDYNAYYDSDAYESDNCDIFHPNRFRY